MRMNVLVAVAAACLTTPVLAGGSSASGGGSLIPAVGTGGTGAVFPLTTPADPAASVANVPVAVTNVDSIEIQGLAHTWIGDTQATLVDPTGVEHLIWLRPGYLNTSTFGNSGDFDGGTYTFVESGGADLPMSSTPAVTPPAGTYNQTFASGGVTWNSGDAGIFNTPMCSITGPSGDWTLKIYDWGSGDTGTFTGWTLNYNGDSCSGGPGDPTPYCFGDGSGTACPCGNAGAAGNGCANGSNFDGANLAWAGSTSVAADDADLVATGLPSPNPTFCLFFQGDAQENGGMGSTLFDGLRCVSGNVIRLGTKMTSAGAATYGDSVGDSIVGAGGATDGATLYYQGWYRNVVGPCNQGANLTNAVEATWAP